MYGLSNGIWMVFVCTQSCLYSKLEPRAMIRFHVYLASPSDNFHTYLESLMFGMTTEEFNYPDLKLILKHHAWDSRGKHWVQGTIPCGKY